MKRYFISLLFLTFIFSFTSCNHFENEEDGVILIINNEQQNNQTATSVNTPINKNSVKIFTQDGIYAVLEAKNGLKYIQFSPIQIDGTTALNNSIEIIFPSVNYKYKYNLYVYYIQNGIIKYFYRELDISFSKDSFNNILNVKLEQSPVDQMYSYWSLTELSIIPDNSNFALFKIDASKYTALNINNPESSYEFYLTEDSTIQLKCSYDLNTMNNYEPIQVWIEHNGTVTEIPLSYIEINPFISTGTFRNAFYNFSITEFGDYKLCIQAKSKVDKGIFVSEYYTIICEENH